MTRAVRLTREGERRTWNERRAVMWHRSIPSTAHDPGQHPEAGARRVGRHRDGRGLGPFSSGHLTIVVVTLIIVVAFPFAAFAVTGNNVFITDFTSGAHAKVDSAGNVQAKLNGGNLNANPTQQASNMFTSTAATGSTGCIVLAAPPVGKALIVTSVKENIWNTTPGHLVEPQIYRMTGNCPTPTNPVSKDTNNVGHDETIVIPFPSGLPIPGGSKLAAQVSETSGDLASVLFTVNGYLVPASQCLSPNVCT
jgi:hypothetical protein